MKSTLLIALAAAMLVSPAFAKPATKPVSGYMRSVGILYLESVEELTLECGQKSIVDSDCKSRWDSTMDGLQDRIEITLSESKRPSGDKPFYELLKATRYARDIYTGASADARKVWSPVYSLCYAHAHTVALEGELFNGDGGCGEAISKATE